MGGPKGVNNIPTQDETGPLLVLLWIEDNLSLTIVVIAGAGISSLNSYRSAELFRAGSEVKRVQPLKIRSSVLAHCHHINGAVWTGGEVYNWRSRDPDFRYNLVAVARIGGRLAAFEHRSVPQCRPEIRVTAINAIMLSGNDHDIVRAAIWNGDLGYNQRLGINLPVHVYLKELPETVEVDVCRRELRLPEVLSCSRQIIVPSQHVYRWKCRGRKDKHAHHNETQGPIHDAGSRFSG